jgi:hypothetical protein
MGLQNGKLPVITISNLYKNCLVDLHQEREQFLQQEDSIHFLGGNNRNILLIVNNLDVPYLTDNDLNFLLGVLSACKLSMADIAVVNFGKTDSSLHKNLPENLKAEVVILFDVEASTLSLPFKIPNFQVQLFKNKKYLFAPALPELQSDIAQKRKLWEALRNIFSI